MNLGRYKFVVWVSFGNLNRDGLQISLHLLDPIDAVSKFCLFLGCPCAGHVNSLGVGNNLRYSIWRANAKCLSVFFDESWKNGSGFLLIVLSFLEIVRDS